VTYELTLGAGTDFLNANQRLHWAKRAHLTRYWRERGKIAATNAQIPWMSKAHVTVTVHKTTNHRFDPANLAPTAKAIVDGLVDAGVLDDDDRTRLVGPDMRAGERRDVRQLVVTITPLEQEATA